MGQKVNPIGLRLGINRGWDSIWLSKKNEYGKLLIEDYKIRKYIKDNVVNSGVSQVLIERTSKKCIVTIFTSRPGFVIGKKGSDIEKIKKNLSKVSSTEVSLNIKEVKKLIEDYFGSIPRGADIVRNFPKEDPITETIYAKAYDSNINIPAIMAAYRTPSMTTKDSRILDMISSYLSTGRSSVLYKKMVDEKKMALQTGAINFSQEDYGTYILFGLPQGETKLADIISEIDEEVLKMQTDLISEKAYQKLQNQFENNYVDSNSSVEGIANSLARYNVLYGDTNLINTEIDIYRSITREEIRNAAKKYLNPNQRLILEYLPESAKQ